MPDTGSTPANLRFTYEKSRLFRVIHVDGVHGGVGPTGRYLNMSMFSERRTIPKFEVFAFAEDGQTLADNRVDYSDVGGVFREVEACVVMNLQVSKVLHAWLGAKIVELEMVQHAMMDRTNESPTP